MKIEGFFLVFFIYVVAGCTSGVSDQKYSDIKKEVEKLNAKTNIFSETVWKDNEILVEKIESNKYLLKVGEMEIENHQIFQKFFYKVYYKYEILENKETYMRITTPSQKTDIGNFRTVFRNNKYIIFEDQINIYSSLIFHKGNFLSTSNDEYVPQNQSNIQSKEKVITYSTTLPGADLLDDMMDALERMTTEGNSTRSNDVNIKLINTANFSIFPNSKKYLLVNIDNLKTYNCYKSTENIYFFILVKTPKNSFETTSLFASYEGPTKVVIVNTHTDIVKEILFEQFDIPLEDVSEHVFTYKIDNKKIVVEDTGFVVFTRSY